VKPDSDDVDFVQEVESFSDQAFLYLPASDHKIQEILEAQRNDPLCKQVVEYCEKEWPPLMPHQPLLQPFWEKKHHFTTKEDLLLYDDRIVIPTSMQLDILNRLHDGHLGITKCKARAAEAVWWPTVTKEVEAMVSQCKICEAHRPQFREPLIPLAFNPRPWDRIGTDLFHHHGKDYVVTIDYTSRWLEFRLLPDTSAEQVISAMKSIFSVHGVPIVVVSDNGPQYACREFKDFAKTWGFVHVTSSPIYPQANGAAERAVQTAKKLLSKNTDPYLALLAYRSSPLHNGYAPSEILMSRKLRTTLPNLATTLRPKVVDQEGLCERENKYREGYKKDFDKRHTTRDSSPLAEGSQVLIRDRNRTATVVASGAGPRSYIVAADGRQLRRNRASLGKVGGQESSPTSPVPQLNASPVKSVPVVNCDPPRPTPVLVVNPGQAPSSPTPVVTRVGRVVRPNPRYSDQ
jgi:transposase InsO family protein